ncbi:hypothetical protein [Streptomyces sp. P17]|uniref:hypothetical protein n=1 Tax=Streptomyces sp. P17 TaxID=3074716 RepID=UPI0028F3F87F|nr:hypothetical protein [Streptomyces sp. P17]MDT9697356.1 hypothetical protein [Streptomyces sp. P17]
MSDTAPSTPHSSLTERLTPDARSRSYSARPGCPLVPGFPRPRTPAFRAHAAAV